MQELKLFANYSKKLVDAKEMKAIELNAEALGISNLQLMENAGRVVANFVDNKYPKSKILIVCGNGNNGGDGFVAARHLLKRHEVTIGLVGGKESIKTPQALINFRILENIKARIVENIIPVLKKEIAEKDVIIVAIFGTGYHNGMPKDIAKAVREISNSGKPVIAVDVPSGLNVGTGQDAEAVRADYTITFHKIKKGLESKKAGKVIVEDIGIPLEAELLTGPGDIYKATMPRSKTSNKYSNGSVVVIGGGSNYHGAPMLAANAAYSALAALRTSVGYAILYTPKEVANIARSISPNLIVKPLGKESIGEGSLEEIRRDIEKSSAIAIGMGIGRDESALKLASEIIKYASSIGKKVVVDADAIYAIKGIKPLGKSVAITPQNKEFEATYGKEPESEENLVERIRQAIDLAKNLSTNVILKGHATIITNGELLKLNVAKTSALATMGSGDVLSGIIASYAASGAEMFDACSAGVYLHSIIGDSLAIEKGTHILANDIIERLPIVLRNYDTDVYD